MAAQKRRRLHGEGASAFGGEIPPQMLKEMRGQIPDEYYFGSVLVDDQDKIYYIDGVRLLPLLGIGQPDTRLVIDAAKFNVVEPIEDAEGSTGFYVDGGTVKSLYQKQQMVVPLSGLDTESTHISFYDFEALSGTPKSTELVERLRRKNQELTSGRQPGFTNMDEAIRRLQRKSTN